MLKQQVAPRIRPEITADDIATEGTEAAFNDWLLDRGSVMFFWSPGNAIEIMTLRFVGQC